MPRTKNKQKVNGKTSQQTIPDATLILNAEPGSFARESCACCKQLRDKSRSEVIDEILSEQVVLDVKDAARRLGISRALAYKLFKRGELEGYTAGRRCLIYLASLIAFTVRNARIKSVPAPTAEPALRRRRTERPPKPMELPLFRHLR